MRRGPQAAAAPKPVSPPNPPAALADLADLARQQAQRVFKKIPLLGPVSWLMMQQSAGRNTLIGELEWRVMPALIFEQAKLYLKDDAPVGFASWARLNDAAARRYREAPHQLALTDWNSGDQVWLIDILAPFGGAQEVLKDLREKVFPGQVLHQLVPTSPSEAEVMDWPAVGVVPKGAAGPRI